MRISILCLLATAPIFAANAAPDEKSATASVTTSATASVDSTYELGGFFGSGEKQEVSLKKRGERASKWVRVGQKTGDLLVESADPVHGFAIVNISGARYRLNLRGEKATSLPAGANSGTVVFSSSAKLAMPLKAANLSPELKAKREKFEAIMSKLTPEQHQLIGRTLAGKMSEALKKNPPGGKDGLSQQQLQELSRGAFRDGIREALQMPGKDGNPGSVPPDFNELFDASSTGEAPIVGAVSAGIRATPVDSEGGGNPGAAPAESGVNVIHLTPGQDPAAIPLTPGSSRTIIFRPEVESRPAPTPEK